MLEDNPDRGTFGDMFGAVNALFSGLAFAGLLIAIYLQRKELELQRRDFLDSIDELKNQTNQFQKQSFENTFFEMLKLHNSNASFYKTQTKKDMFSNERQIFKTLYDYLKGLYASGVKTGKFNSPNIRENVKLAYISFYEDSLEFLPRYFNNLFNIIDFIDLSDVNNKEFYIRLISAQLTLYEQMLLFYHCTCYDDARDFRILMKNYKLLNNLLKERLIEKNFVLSEVWFYSLIPV